MSQKGDVTLDAIYPEPGTLTREEYLARQEAKTLHRCPQCNNISIAPGRECRECWDEYWAEQGIG